MNLYAVQLECLLVILGIGVLMIDAFRPIHDKRQLGLVLATLVGITFLYSFTLRPLDESFFGGLYCLDSFALFFKRLFLVVLGLVLVMSAEFISRIEGGHAEFYTLLLFCSAGMLLIASVNDFIFLFVALELVTISFYILTSFLRRQIPCLEAGTKYLILGALSSGILVYGIVYLFGTTGTTNFNAMHDHLIAAGGSISKAFVFGILLVIAGLGFKVASVPFQLWAPDVYQGAPTPVTAFLAAGSKVAGFALLLRVLLRGLVPVQNIWAVVLMLLAGGTLLYGNFGALPQRNLKRLLGYSSIGHAGFMLMGIAAVNSLGASAVFFYLGQYAVTNVCAFLAIIAVTNVTRNDEISAYSGLHSRSPLLAAALFIAMLSLAGIPPLSGFFAKFQLFAAVIERASVNWHYFILAAVAAIAVIISLYFYLGVARAIYIQPAIGDTTDIPVSTSTRIALYGCMAIIIGLGIYQRPLVDASISAAKIFWLP